VPSECNAPRTVDVDHAVRVFHAGIVSVEHADTVFYTNGVPKPTG
jgi:hypothetical protein